MLGQVSKIIMGILLTTVPLIAQSSEGSKPIYRLQGSQVPRYDLVETFLTAVPELMEAGPVMHAHLMDQFGIPLGSDAERDLLRAFEEARRLLRGDESPIIESYSSSTLQEVRKTKPPSKVEGVKESTEEARAKARARTIRRARGMADIFVDLRGALQRSAISIENIERYMTEQLAPGLSVSSDKPLDMTDPAIAAFESQMQLREQQAAAEKNEEE